MHLRLVLRDDLHNVEQTLGVRGTHARGGGCGEEENDVTRTADMQFRLRRSATALSSAVIPSTDSRLSLSAGIPPGVFGGTPFRVYPIPC